MNSLLTRVELLSVEGVKRKADDLLQRKRPLTDKEEKEVEDLESIYIELKKYINPLNLYFDVESQPKVRASKFEEVASPPNATDEELSKMHLRYYSQASKNMATLGTKINNITLVTITTEKGKTTTIYLLMSKLLKGHQALEKAVTIMKGPKVYSRDILKNGMRTTFNKVLLALGATVEVTLERLETLGVERIESEGETIEELIEMGVTIKELYDAGYFKDYTLEDLLSMKGITKEKLEEVGYDVFDKE
jgi:hypothetical protein